MKAPQPYCIACYEKAQAKKSKIRKFFDFFLPTHMTDPRYSREFDMAPMVKNVWVCLECGESQSYRRIK